MVILVSSINREKLDLNITKIDEPVINVNVGTVEAPQILLPGFTVTEVLFPATPIANLPSGINQNSYQGKSIGNTNYSTQYSISGNGMFENLNVTSLVRTSLTLNRNTKSIDIAGEMSYTNGSYTGKAMF